MSDNDQTVIVRDPITPANETTIKQLIEDNAKLRGAMHADDERLRTAGERVGIVAGCDTAEQMADEIIRLREYDEIAKNNAAEQAAISEWRRAECVKLRADIERIGRERDQMIAANVELQERLSRLEDDLK